MKNIIKGTILLLVVLIFTSAASAEILVGQTKAVYNVGDNFEIKITLTSSKFTSDFFIATLVCEHGEQIELFKSPYTLKETEQKEVIISTNLGNFLVGERNGKCYLKTTFDNSEVTSQNFQILSTIDVTLNVGGTAFNPEEQVKVYGTAVKTNEQPLNGFVDITVSNIGVSISAPVKNGTFESSFTIPSNAASGIYELNAVAYEKDNSGKTMNQGTGRNNIRVKQVIKKMEIALNQQSVIPNSEILYTVAVYDQAGQTVETDSSVTIYSSDGKISKRAIVKTNKATSLQTKSNDTTGYWKISSTVGALTAEKTFLMEELQQIIYSLDGQTLTITNVGNVPYTKPIEILIGGVSEIRDIKALAVGTSKKYKLLAPDGNYDIEISDGTDKQNIGTTFLTGRAVSVEDIGGALSKNLTILISLIAILVIAIIGLYFYRKISKNRKGEKIPDVVTTQPKQQVKSPESLNLIDKGEKQESEIVSIKMKNSEVLYAQESDALKALDSALWKAAESGAKVYTDGDFRIIVFTQILTKQRDNTLSAITNAQTIERILREYNKRSKQKIEFGVAVHTGNLIVESKEGKFRFISADNSIAVAKRMSGEATSEVLISEALHRKTVGKIKVEKLKDKSLWRVDKVIDRTQHEDFIKNFKGRQK